MFFLDFEIEVSLYEEKHPGKTSDHDPAFAKRLKIFN